MLFFTCNIFDCFYKISLDFLQNFGFVVFEEAETVQQVLDSKVCIGGTTKVAVKQKHLFNE